MIRPITLLAFFAAAGSGLYLYQTKLSAQLLDQRITHTVNDIRKARQRTALLTAEYALLNDPTRLQQLSNEFLQLPPTKPGQYVTMADLASRLPPVGPPPAAPAPPQEAAPPVDVPGAAPNGGPGGVPGNAPSAVPNGGIPMASAPAAGAPAGAVPPAVAPAVASAAPSSAVPYGAGPSSVGATNTAPPATTAVRVASVLAPPPPAPPSVIASAPARVAVIARRAPAPPGRTAGVHLPDIRRLLADTPPSQTTTLADAQPVAHPYGRRVAPAPPTVQTAQVAMARPVPLRPAAIHTVAVHTVAMRPTPAHPTGAVSMLGMAWTAQGQSANAPGGSR